MKHFNWSCLKRTIPSSAYIIEQVLVHYAIVGKIPTDGVSIGAGREYDLVLEWVVLSSTICILVTLGSVVFAWSCLDRTIHLECLKKMLGHAAVYVKNAPNLYVLGFLIVSLSKLLKLSHAIQVWNVPGTCSSHSPCRCSEWTSEFILLCKHKQTTRNLIVPKTSNKQLAFLSKTNPLSIVTSEHAAFPTSFLVHPDDAHWFSTLSFLAIKDFKCVNPARGTQQSHQQSRMVPPRLRFHHATQDPCQPGHNPITYWSLLSNHKFVRTW
jgi:hypothetical protein